MEKIISKKAIERRLYWIEEIVKISGHFGLDSSRVENELKKEISSHGAAAILDHLRLCTAIPESYGHDSSEEKLYSKYTDALISATFREFGLKSVVLTERADAADVEAVATDYSFVADAKVFRLSRTAKNQKDFKVQAMDGWKRGKPFAMVVCPLYQLPARSSQIYQQAATRGVCIFSYSHLAVLIRLSQLKGKASAEKLLHGIFKVIEGLNVSKGAADYWRPVNSSMLDFDPAIGDIWKQEKLAALEGIEASKEIALNYLASERERIMRLSHDEAIKQLVEMHKIDSRASVIKGVRDNDIMSI